MQTLDDNAKKNVHGLGRGLDSLIPTGFDMDEPVEKATGKIAVDLIDPNPQQPRREFEEGALIDLANSIRKYGIIQPLLVSKTGSRYELVAGERRLRAAKVAGLKEVPVIERSLEEQEKLEVAIIENLQREDLNPLDLAYSYKKLMDQFNLTQEEVAEKIGKARSTVANTMRLTTLPHEVKQALINGKITEGHARALLNLSSVKEQLEMLDRLITRNMNVRDLENKVAVQKHTRTLVKDPNLMAAEKKIAEAIGSKAKIKTVGKGGKIIIDYYSLEDFERIYKKITE
jgi:ParB family chromosome partitioning protein